MLFLKTRTNDLGIYLRRMTMCYFNTSNPFNRMAKYYTKVMEKLDGAGDGFIESEIERIGRMLGTAN